MLASARDTQAVHHRNRGAEAEPRRWLWAWGAHAGVVLGSWTPPGPVLAHRGDVQQDAAPTRHRAAGVSPAASPIPPVSLCLARLQGVKLLFLCKLGLINPFHQLQIYLLNPIKNMNMQIQTFFNTHFQGLGVRLDYSIPVNSL